MAKENTLPSRIISGQVTAVSGDGGVHDIRYDPVNDEILIPNPAASAIVVFRGAANGEEAPIRTIIGDKTLLGGVSRVDVDPVHNEIFVPGGNKISVFPREANGDVAPIRVIQGPDTGLRRSAAMAVDPVHNLIVVGAWAGEGKDIRADLLIFNRTDNGNVKPRAVIRGPRTGPPPNYETFGQLQVYPAKGWIIACIHGLHGSWESSSAFAPFVGIWSIDDNGDVPPRWKLCGPKSTLARPRGVVLEPKNKELIVADMHLNTILTYYFPELF